MVFLFASEEGKSGCEPMVGNSDVGFCYTFLLSCKIISGDWAQKKTVEFPSYHLSNKHKHLDINTLNWPLNHVLWQSLAPVVFFSS